MKSCEPISCVNEFAQDLEKAFRRQNLKYDVWYDTNTVSVEIRNGHWRQDHINSRQIIRDVAKTKRLPIYIRIVDEDIDNLDKTNYTATYMIGIDMTRKTKKKGM